MQEVEIWTDGANSGPQQRGGWAAIIVDPSGTKLAISGFEAATTSNRMELTACVMGLDTITNRSIITIFTDSAYVKNPFTKGWLKRWRANGWKTAEGTPIANKDLWELLIIHGANHEISWRKVRGHSKTWSLNTLADEMAVEAKIKQVGVTILL